MELSLTQVEIRILGCLIEKKMATPEYYPLSLNALVNACNQKSNREPVVAWDEQTVLQGIEGLASKRLIFQSHLSRVPKYEESYLNESSFIPSESAILCMLMLRGPQTAGEIRSRTERLYAFENLEHVNRILEHLMSLNHVLRMSRQPGRKEVRYCHTMGHVQEDEPLLEADFEENLQARKPNESGRIDALEEKVESLTAELEALKQQLADFQKQFE
ncbi:MAG: YceH family protein [Proteobacteria bacterium]|nr:YceH family protein [Pseudomonadota bacterium]